MFLNSLNSYKSGCCGEWIVQLPSNTMVGHLDKGVYSEGGPVCECTRSGTVGKVYTRGAYFLIHC